jgi:dolichyl-diphosphooligosaccharide--protein glycosyltransferase
VEFLLTTEGIAETTSIVSGDLGTLVGPVFLFGFVLFLALGHMGWAVWTSYRRHAPVWLAVGVYAWYFLLLSAIQVRFAGQLALFTALFGGLAFVHLAAWVDMASVPKPFKPAEKSSRVSSEGSGDDDELEWPERRQVLYTGALGLGVGSLGGLLTPIRHSQLTVDDSMYEAATFMQEYSAERDWEYPENYVFSQWGQNRFYNWFVNAETRSYRYAQSNFDEFLISRDSGEWYERLRDRAGFVAVKEGDVSGGGQAGTIYDQLWSDGFGIETDHYRAVWTDSDDSLRAFTLVPGARVTGPASANSTTIDVTAEVGGESQSIVMETDVSEHGVYEETVPLPGTYEAGGTSVTVSEEDVRGGAFVSGFDGEGYAHWSFDEGSGEWAYDRVGGHHGRIHGAEWTDEGRSGSALSFGGKNSSDYVEAPVDSLQEFTISLWAYPTALDVSEENDFRDIVRTDRGSILIFEQHGQVSFRLPRTDTERLTTEPTGGVSTDTWNHVVVTFDGSVRRVYVDKGQQTSDDVSVDRLDWGKAVRLGNSFETFKHGYAGILDDVRIYEEALSPAENPALFG